MAEHDLISKKSLLEYLDMAMECENCPRNADKELYKCVHNPTSERCTCSDIAQICIRITEFATFSDVQPVKHGKWTWDSNAPHREHGAYKCSNCGCHSDFEENYCYDCGARMDGDIE